MNILRFLVCLGVLILSSKTRADDRSAGSLWAELARNREQLTSAHQEFEVSRTFKTATSTQASTRRIVLDLAGQKWREKTLSGSGDYIQLFDGDQEYRMEEGGNEFERIKRQSKEDTPKPEMYADDAEWGKAVEKERRPCGLPQFPHDCVVLEAPLRTRVHGAGAESSRLAQGVVQVRIDTATGLILSRHSVALIQRTRDQYQADTRFVLKRADFGAPPDATLFHLPSTEMKEVKTLSRWDAAKIRKQLGGKEAPELDATDITGKPVSLAAFKGKVVLLDFWTTWCPPCRADAPSLDKLYRKYGNRDLVIIGVSVSEERPIVEKFLKEHPHDFPVMLTS